MSTIFTKRDVYKLAHEMPNSFVSVYHHSPGDGATRYEINTTGGHYFVAVGAKDAMWILYALRSGYACGSGSSTTELLGTLNKQAKTIAGYDERVELANARIAELEHTLEAVMLRPEGATVWLEMPSISHSVLVVDGEEPHIPECRGCGRLVLGLPENWESISNGALTYTVGGVGGPLMLRGDVYHGQDCVDLEDERRSQP